jgi:uncharacterized protein (TIGR02677 family)
MQVSVRLRATGFHAKRGRSGTIIDRSDGKARLATLAAEEAVQIEKAQNRLAGLGRIRSSGIGLLDRAEFDLFLDLLGEALAMKPSVNEAVETVSSNGLLRITMEPILDTDDSPARAIIPTEDGQLSGPDHFVTIEHVFSQTTRPNLANHVTVNRA